MVDNTIRLKFKADMRADLEFQLVHKFGFTYYSRKGEEWVVYMKDRSQPENSHGLSEAAIRDLNRRVDAICKVFSDPDANKDIIKVRLLEMCKTVNLKQAAWVHAWIKHVLDEDDTVDDPPWEDGVTK